MREIKTIELDKYENMPDGIHVKHVGMVTAQEAFDRLKNHLVDVGLLPDEYFIPSSRNMDEELPDFRTAICHVDWGSSEGIYLDISFEYFAGKERKLFPLATGKTLDASGDAYMRMSRIAAECSMMLNGRGDIVKVSKHLYEAEKQPETTVKSGSRMDQLHAYKQNADILKNTAEAKEQAKALNLIVQIKSLAPRIRELITTGNACLENNIPLTGQAWGAHEGYDTNQFFTNCWSHLVGFVGNPKQKDCHIEFMGINAGGACGKYDFRTDGVKVFDTAGPHDIIAPSIGHMEKFLSKFDEFETSFYAYVDKVIEKQQNELNKLDVSVQPQSRLKAVNIKWDVDYDSDREFLPTEIEIPAGMTDEDEIADYLSDVTGFCHDGFQLVECKKNSLDAQIQSASTRAAESHSDSAPVKQAVVGPEI